MKNNKLMIVWKPDVLSMAHHNGSFETKKDKWGHSTIKINSNHKGLTARSEVETFSNIKSIDAAKKLILRRNVEQIIVATYNDEEINVRPTKKKRISFIKRIKRRITALYSNDYSKLQKSLSTQ